MLLLVPMSALCACLYLILYEIYFLSKIVEFLRTFEQHLHVDRRYYAQWTHCRLHVGLLCSHTKNGNQTTCASGIINIRKLFLKFSVRFSITGSTLYIGGSLYGKSRVASNHTCK